MFVRSFSETGHRILLKLGMQLKDNSRKKLTKSDFLGNYGSRVLGSNEVKRGQNWSFLGSI